MGRPVRLAEVARPGAGCAIRTNGQGASAGGQSRARGPCGWDGWRPGGGLVKERNEHNWNNPPRRAKSPPDHMPLMEAGGR
jgi:hypothetical protein